jgi:oligo-1,6-glucosidase
MTNFDFKSIDELNDVESHSLNRLMKKMHLPAFLRWKWIKESSRDNARTPMQWENGNNAGFSKVKPWLGINSNYMQINYASQKNDPNSVLNFYKTLIALRQKSDCLKNGSFEPIHAGKSLMLYKRCLEPETYIIALNFSSRKERVPKKFNSFFIERPLISNTNRISFNGTLLPWEGVLLRYGE